MSLERLSQAAGQLSPALIQSDSAEWDCTLDMDASPEQTLALLHQRLQQNHPDTPPLYWGVQVWRQVSWQPIYLAVAAVHNANILPQLGLIKQRLQDCSVYHYDVKPSSWQSGKTATLIEDAAGQLQSLAAHWLGLIANFGKLGRKAAYYLMADALCHSLLLLVGQGKSQSEIAAYSRDWLDALTLTQCPGLQYQSIAGGEKNLVLKRSSCCLKYFANPGALCGNCPKRRRA